MLKFAPPLALIYDLYRPIENGLEWAFPSTYPKWKQDLEKTPIPFIEGDFVPTEIPLLAQKAISIGVKGAVCSFLFLRCIAHAPLISSTLLATSFGVGATIYMGMRIAEIKLPTINTVANQVPITMHTAANKAWSATWNSLIKNFNTN